MSPQREVIHHGRGSTGRSSHLCSGGESTFRKKQRQLLKHYCKLWVNIMVVLGLIWAVNVSFQPTSSFENIFLQCFDTVGCVIWPVKPVPSITYVFGGTLNLVLSIYLFENIEFCNYIRLDVETVLFGMLQLSALSLASLCMEDSCTRSMMSASMKTRSCSTGGSSSELPVLCWHWCRAFCSFARDAAAETIPATTWPESSRSTIKRHYASGSDFKLSRPQLYDIQPYGRRHWWRDGMRQNFELLMQK